MGILTSKPSQQSGPAWDIARLFPNQGDWSELEYLELNRRTNHFVELSDGNIEVLDMPSLSHQRIVLFLRDMLLSFVNPRKLGEVVVAPYPVRLRQGRFREPDVVFVLAEHSQRLQEDFADGADLVIEVVSEDRRRDLETKRAEYAEAGIPEYWIVDPKEQRISVLRLTTQGYAEAVFSRAQTAASVLLPEFTISVDGTFAAAGH